MQQFRKLGRRVTFIGGSVDGSQQVTAPDATPKFSVWRKRGATAAVAITALTNVDFELLATGQYVGSFELAATYNAGVEAGFQNGDIYLVFATRVKDSITGLLPIGAGVVTAADMEDLLTLASQIDGIALSELWAGVQAVLHGVTNVENGVVEFMLRDRVTPAVTVTIGATPGARTSSVLPSEE